MRESIYDGGPLALWADIGGGHHLPINPLFIGPWWGVGGA